jgi:diguanylate cyclase (GGDEF)-like protein
MEKILIITEQRGFGELVSESIHGKTGFECEIVLSSGGYMEKMKDFEKRFFLAIADLDTRGKMNEKLLNDVLEANVPSIVLTRDFNDNLRDKVLTRKIIDYIIKDSFDFIDSLTRLIDRIRKNESIRILVVDDSAVSRAVIGELLNIQKFTVLEAGDGDEALKVLASEPDIKLIIIDYNMPGLDGYELTTKIRKTRPKDEVAIIGISAYGAIISGQFLKKGANDFILKPFSKEEFCCRIIQNVELLEYIGKEREAAYIDFLTDLPNRRHFFSVGEKMFANAVREHIQIIIAMLDIDGFSQVNDDYGHLAGDEVLKSVANVMKAKLRKADIMARFGGDEFCFLAVNMGDENVKWKFEDLNNSLKALKIQVSDMTLSVSLSVGVAIRLENTLEQTIKKAETLMNKAKKYGRNTIYIEE